MPALGGCQILTLEAPLITEKAPYMHNGYIYSKDDVRSPLVKPPCVHPVVPKLEDSKNMNKIIFEK
jgi:hypothetical protein